MTRFDDTIDAAFEPLRGMQKIDQGAALASNLADYGLIWVALALFKAQRRGPERRRAVAALALSGVSSYGINRAVKSSVARPRPTEHLEAAVRPPSSSSFPSGHTLAAFCTAFALAESGTETAAYVGFAGIVAASRIHLRAHHPSDVVGGAAIGSLLGLAQRPLLNRLTPGGRSRLARTAARSAKGMRAEGYLLKRL